MHLPNTPDPNALTPETLLATLDSGLSDLDAICQELHCTPDDLAATLEDPQTSRLLQTRATLAATRVHLTAIRYAPHAISKLQHLAETADKPEVVRRSSTTLINLAGIPTTAQHPPHTPPKAPKAPAKTEFAQPPKNRDWDIAMKYALKMVTLRNSHGMDIHNIPDHLYPAFIDALYNFFTSHRLPFVGNVENPYPYIDAEVREKAAAKSQTPIPQPENPPAS